MTTGPIQFETIPWNCGTQKITAQTPAPLAVEMKRMPRISKILPIECTVPNLIALVKIRIKAFQAELQKFFPVMAHYKQ